MTPEEIAAGEFQGFGEGNSLNASAIGKVTVGSDTLFWKGTGNRLAAHESLVASLFEKAGLRTPAVRPAEIDGAPVLEGAEGGGMVAELINGVTLQEEMENNNISFDEIEQRLQPGEVDRNAILAFLLHLGDRHHGNYMVEGNRLVSIDHEFSLGRAFMGRDKPPEELKDYGANAIGYLSEGILRKRSKKDAMNMTMTLNENAVKDIAGIADDIASSVEQADPQRGTLVRRHAEALKKWAAGNNFSIAALHTNLQETIKSDPVNLQQTIVP